MKKKLFRFTWLVLVALLAAVLCFAYNSQRKFEKKLIANFQTQQCLLLISLGTDVETHVNGLIQSLEKTAAELGRTGNRKADAEVISTVLSSPHDQLVSVAILDSTGNVLVMIPDSTPADSILMRGKREFFLPYVRTSRPFVSEGNFDSQNRLHKEIYVPFVRNNRNLLLMGKIRIDEYLSSLLTRFPGEPLYMIVADSSGNIQCLVNSKHDDPVNMAKGNLFSLDDKCLSCHGPDDFLDIRQAIREERTVHTLATSPDGRTTTRSTVSFPVYNEIWSMSIFSPYENMQGMINANFLNTLLYILILFLGGIGFFIYFLLIQKRKAIQQGETKFRALTEVLNVGVFRNMAGPEGKPLEMNSAFIRLFGYDTEGEMKKVLVTELYHDPEQRRKFQENIKTKGFVKNEELILRRKDGSTFVANVSVVMVNDDYGIPRYFDGVIEDITEQKQVEQELKVSEERFRNLTESATDGIISLDSKGCLNLYNPAAKRIFGYDPEEVLGQPVSIFVPERFGKIFMNAIARYEDNMTSSILGRTLEYVGIRKGGETFPLELSLSVVKVGSEWNFIGIVRDICERKRAADELEISKEALERSNSTKDKFFSIIAHDLKGPFNSILGLTNALLMDFHMMDGKSIERLLRTIKGSSEKAFVLLENLMVWANSQTGQLTFQPEKLAVSSIAADTVALLESQALAKGIRLSKNMKEAELIEGDRQMLQTVLRNLLSNAIKFTPQGGQVAITVQETEGSCRVDVKDSGVGISVDRLSTLFDIGSKESTRGTADEKGTGLGLILCREFVERHGGKIWVESEEGKGSTFSFTIPYKHH